jgi:hypothetical protein
MACVEIERRGCGHGCIERIWIFDFERLDGTSMHMEELAYQRWEGEKIAAETFSYDPAQQSRVRAWRSLKETPRDRP